MPRRSDEGVELSDGRVIEPETATEGSEFVKDQKTNIAAELQAGGGPVNGWESIWAAGLQPGQRFDAGRPSQALVKKLDSGDLNVNGKKCLVPGCGRGYDVLEFAKRGASHAYGLELAPTAVTAATIHRDEQMIEQHQPVQAASFVQADFFTFGKPDHSNPDSPGNWYWDVGYDYTFLCALQPEQRELWAATWYDLIKEEGRLVCLIFPIDPDRQGGPPFAVTTGLYRNLLENVGFELESLEPVPEEVSHEGRGGKEAIGIWRRSTL